MTWKERVFCTLLVLFTIGMYAAMILFVAKFLTGWIVK